MHWWLKSLSTHIPCLQGLALQRSIFSWQRLPVNPEGHAQLKSATKSVQLDPSRHGRSAQSSERNKFYVLLKLLISPNLLTSWSFSCACMVSVFLHELTWMCFIHTCRTDLVKKSIASWSKNRLLLLCDLTNHRHISTQKLHKSYHLQQIVHKPFRYKLT
jgi:hypothetical protein